MDWTLVLFWITRTLLPRRGEKKRSPNTYFSSGKSLTVHDWVTNSCRTYRNFQEEVIWIRIRKIILYGLLPINPTQGWQNRGTRPHPIIVCLANSLLKHRSTSHADLIFSYLPNKVKLHYKNGSAQKILTWQFRGKGRNLSVCTANSFAAQWTHEGKGKEDKRKGRETRGREGWEEIEDTSWVQFRGFPQEMEWPVSATIEVMQFLVDTSVFREYRGPPLWCAHPEEKAKGPHSTPDPPEWPDQ